MSAFIQSLPKLLTPEETANILGIKTQTLALWRCHGRYDLAWIKVGRLVRYREDDVAAFLSRNRIAESREGQV